MKKSLVFLALLSALTACQDDTKQLLKTIDGTWRVNSVAFGRVAGPDSVAVGQSATLNFDRCDKSTNQNSPGNCPVVYTVGNQPFRFTYQATDGRKSLYIAPTSAIGDPAYAAVSRQIAGSYDIVALTETSLIIRRSLQGSLPGYATIQFSATK